MQPCIHIKLEPPPDQDGSGNKKLNRGHKVLTAPISVLGLLLPFINLTY